MRTLSEFQSHVISERSIVDYARKARAYAQSLPITDEQRWKQSYAIYRGIVRAVEQNLLNPLIIRTDDGNQYWGSVLFLDRVHTHGRHGTKYTSKMRIEFIQTGYPRGNLGIAHYTSDSKVHDTRDVIRVFDVDDVTPAGILSFVKKNSSILTHEISHKIQKYGEMDGINIYHTPNVLKNDRRISFS